MNKCHLHKKTDTPEYNGFFSPDTESNCEKMMQDDYDGTSDQFWGITFSVIYSFNI